MSRPPSAVACRAAPLGLPGWSLVVAAAVASGGCLLAGSRPDADPPSQLTLGGDGHSTPANHTIPLELSFVRHDPDDEILRDELWLHVDEQALPADLRRRLAANGLRAGVVGGHLPPHLAARFAADAAQPATARLPTDATVSRRLMRLLPGRRGEILTATGIPELVLLEQTGDGVQGGTYRDASPLFAIEARPAANGRVHLEVTPEIRHGPVEKSWVGEDGMLRLEAGQRRHSLDELRFSITLPRQAMLLLGCAGDGMATAGDCLLRDGGKGGSATVRVLAIRPLADTTDPLFAAEADAADAGDEAPLVVR